MRALLLLVAAIVLGTPLAHATCGDRTYNTCVAHDDGYDLWCYGSDCSYYDDVAHTVSSSFLHTNFLNRSGQRVSISYAALVDYGNDWWFLGATALDPDALDAGVDHDGELVGTVPVDCIGTDQWDCSIEQSPLANGYRLYAAVTCHNGVTTTTTLDTTETAAWGYWQFAIPPTACLDETWEGAFVSGFDQADAAVDAAMPSPAEERYRVNVRNSSDAALLVTNAWIRNADTAGALTFVHAGFDTVAVGEESESCDGTCQDPWVIEQTGWSQASVQWVLTLHCGATITQVESPVLLDADVWNSDNGLGENYVVADVYDCDNGLVIWEYGVGTAFSEVSAEHAVTVALSQTPDGSGDDEEIAAYVGAGTVPSALSDVGATGGLAGLTCATSAGVDASATGDVLRHYDLSHGCACDDADQADGSCEDYALTLHYGWSNWFGPTDGDGTAIWFSSLQTADRIGCDAPAKAQARHSSGAVYEAVHEGVEVYLDDVTGADAIRFFKNGRKSVKCIESQPGDCDDWTYRYYCDE
jgi:hypothetical protein